MFHIEHSPFGRPAVILALDDSVSAQPVTFVNAVPPTPTRARRTRRATASAARRFFVDGGRAPRRGHLRQKRLPHLRQGQFTLHSYCYTCIYDFN